MNSYIKSLLSALIFSVLFYQKDLGVNILLFTVLVTLLLLTKENKPPSVYLIIYFLTALVFFLDPTSFKIFIHAMAFLVLIGKQIAPKSSLYTNWFMGLINMLVASIYSFQEYLQKPASERNKLSPKLISIFKGILISLVLIALFSFLYKDANPIFGDLIDQINFDFISFSWIAFTALGYLLALNILEPYYPETLIAIDNAQKNELPKPSLPFDEPKLKKVQNEHTLGCIVLGALNVLLVLYLITDSIYLINTKEFSNSEFSAAVHQGIYALLLSVICAIGIIVYFFREDLNFITNNKLIKNLSYGWLLLNLMLVLFTGFKNFIYVEALGLTYKRIGVFVYLLLVLFGLCTTYIKVAQIKSFIYLIRVNIGLWFIFLFTSASIPWDRAITSYNLNYIENPDIGYLINLGETNSFQLQQYKLLKEKSISPNNRIEIEQKHAFKLKKNKQKTWQEYSIYHFITN